MPTLFLLAAALAAEINTPQVLDDRLQLQLVAAEPDVVTPTGLTVDEQGRVLVIESHTHFRPEGYKGPAHDRILLLDDFDPATGKARKISVFFEGTTHTMSLAVYYDGSIYVATRSEIFRLRDKDNDGKADGLTRICRLETEGNYPHNGLSGFAFDFAGNVYFGFGENLGATYRLIGSDGKSLSGGGEGGNIYYCDPEGRNVRRVATGFWNPFHLCFDAFGRLFAVDNDPDSRPPCRLLHIVEGGDYGYRFRNGRKGVHPFTAWNGELPGTLPMVAGTGEAPCAVLAYESDNLPEEYRGDLLVTSWGDHRLERYRLRPRGASFGAEMTPVIRGDENFRPVGLALAPDGSLYFSDWVDKSYNLHGKGRVWRLSAKNPPQPNRPADTIAALSSPHGPWREAAARKVDNETAKKISIQSPEARTRYSCGVKAFAESDDGGAFLALLAAQEPKVANLFCASADDEDAYGAWHRAVIDIYFSKETARQELRERSLRIPMIIDDIDTKQFDAILESDDPFIPLAWMHGESAQPKVVAQLLENPERLVAHDEPGSSLWFAIDARAKVGNQARCLIPYLLRHRAPAVQLYGVIWIGEERAIEHKELLLEFLSQAKDRQRFETALAALSLLESTLPQNPKSEIAGEEYVGRLLFSSNANADVRRFALRSLRADHPLLTTERMRQLLSDPDSAIRLEAIRTIRQRPDAERWPQLREIAAASDKSTQERCEAILCLSPGNDDDRKTLFELVSGENAEVADEALRALRGFDLNDGEKQALSDLAEKLASPRKELAQRVLARNPPKDLPKHDDHAAWLKLAEGEGNAQAGERIFYHLRVGGCFRCHEFEGRGYQIGPDLTNIGRTMTRERLVQSIVDPSREIAPMFANWAILTKDGEAKTGIHVGDEVDGRIKFADQNGRVFHVHPNDIDRRQPSSQSIMPASLADNLTPQELRDLLAFLMGDPK